MKSNKPFYFVLFATVLAVFVSQNLLGQNELKNPIRVSNEDKLNFAI